MTTDRLGSVRSLARRDGTWALTQRFAAYGERLSRDTSASYGLGARLRYGWTGREYDVETGFSFHRARYYLPTLRRWTQEDPIGYGGGGNLYAYVGGAPLEVRDPSGLQTDEDTYSPHAWTFCTMAGNCASPFGNIIGALEARLPEGGGGTGWGVSHLDGTMAAGWAAYEFSIKWREYKANFAALKADMMNSSSPEMEGLFAAAAAFDEGEYSRAGRVIMYSLARRGLEQLRYATAINERIGRGAIFKNSQLDKNHPGLTMSGYTGISRSAFTNGDAYLMNVFVHEQDHVFHPGSGQDNPEAHCSVYRRADALTGYNMLPRSVLKCN